MAATSACSLSACPAFFFLLASGFLGAGRASTSFAHAVKVLYLNKFHCIMLCTRPCNKPCIPSDMPLFSHRVHAFLNSPDKLYTYTRGTW